MEQNKSPLVVSITGLPKRKQKKVVSRITKEVTRDKQFKKALRKSETKVTKPVRNAVVKAAVEATLGTKTGEPALPRERTGLEVYTDLVLKFAAARRKYKKKKKKAFKKAKRDGYKPKIGLYKLEKLEKVNLAEKVKPYAPPKE